MIQISITKKSIKSCGFYYAWRLGDSEAEMLNIHVWHWLMNID